MKRILLAFLLCFSALGAVSNADLIGTTGNVQQQINSLPARVDTISDLLSDSSLTNHQIVLVSGYSDKDSVGGGYFRRVIGGSAQTNLGTVFGFSGGQWHRVTDGTKYDPCWFGAVPNDNLDDFRAVTNMIAVAGSTPMVFPKGRFDYSDTLVSLPNTASGIGISSQSLIGVGFNGTSATTNALSAEHTTFCAHHLGPILQYAGTGGKVTGLNMVFASAPTTNDTSAVCILLDGADTVMSTFEDLRFYNGYRSFSAPNSGYQYFSSTMKDILILGFVNGAFSLQAPGTQGIFQNVYITTAGTNLISSEVASVSTVGKVSTFALSASFASLFDAGELVTISECDNSGLNGNHTIINRTATTIDIEWQTTPSPLPTTAKVSKNGGSGVIDGYVIQCNQYRQDEWINLNVEWLRCVNGQGLLFGDRTTINGLHLEGIGFSSDSFSSGSFVRGLGPLVVTGWDLFNSYVATNQSWNVFGATTTNSRVTLLGGRVRDTYYNPGSTLSVCGTVSGLPDDSLYFDSVVTWNTSRWNRTGNFTGVNYAKKFVGADDGTGKITAGSASAGTSMALKGGSGGARIITLDRSGNDLIGIGATTDGINFFNETDGRGIASLTENSTTIGLNFGSFFTATSPNVVISGPTTTTGTNIASGSMTLQVPAGTGNSTSGGEFSIATPDVTSSGAASQTVSTKFRIKREGQFKFYPRSSAPTISVEDGDAYYDTTLKKLRIREDGAWVNLP